MESSEELLLRSQKCYRGRGKISIKHLRFESEGLPGGHIFDERKVDRLLKKFRTVGCLRLEPAHFISALIDRSTFEEALRITDIDENALIDRNQLPPCLLLAEDDVLTALDGKHRIAAAEKFLEPHEHWWIVDIYTDDLPATSCLKLRTKGSNAQGFSDGEIFRNLRKAEVTGNRADAQAWRALLSDTKLRNVDALAKIHSLSTAFDSLLEYVGLWTSFQLGTLNRILALNCEEELTRYLHHVLVTWQSILACSRPDSLDAKSVKLLQLLAPGHSSQDRAMITMGMSCRELFSKIDDQRSRDVILTELLSIEWRIPSLFTFSEDTIYLEPCAEIMRKLIPTRSGVSIFQTFTLHYTGNLEDNTTIVQIQEDATTNVATNEALRLKYLQLWLFCMRHFPSLQDVNPRKDRGRPKVMHGLKMDLETHLGKLAAKLGFRSSKINALSEQDPLESLTRAFISKARPPECHEWDSEAIEEGIRYIRDFLQSIPAKETPDSQAMVSTNIREEPLLHRCGRPFESAYVSNRNLLFLQNMYRDYQDQHERYISSFGVQRDIFLSFFGFDVVRRQGHVPRDALDTYTSISEYLRVTSGQSDSMHSARTASSVYTAYVDREAEHPPENANTDYSPATEDVHLTLRLNHVEPGDLQPTPTVTSFQLNGCTEDAEALYNSLCGNETQILALYNVQNRNIHLITGRYHRERGRRKFEEIQSVQGGHFILHPHAEGFYDWDSEQDDLFYICGRNGRNLANRHAEGDTRLLLEAFYSKDHADSTMRAWPFQATAEQI